MNIPFKKAYYDDRELDCIKDALLCTTDYVSKAKELLIQKYNNENIFLTASGSTAFDLLFYALDLERGGEVIMPSYTFPSCANSAVRAGLKPVFADIDIKTKVLDIEDINKKISSKTRCIVTMHYGGSSADMEKLKAYSGDILLIEDAALSFGAQYKDKELGTIGDMGMISFHGTKNISSCKGGILMVNPEFKDIIKKIQIIYDNGTDKNDFLKGKVESYTWQNAGMNASMSNINAAVLFSQLRKAEEITLKQKVIWEFYQKNLARLSNDYCFSLPYIPIYNKNNYHIFYIMLKNFETREAVRKYLGRKNIGAYFHYMPLHSSNMGRKLGYGHNDLPVSQSVSSRILRLPLYADMKIPECERVISVLKEALCKK